MFPSKLLDHTLWWNGQTWLGQFPDNWPQQSTLPPNEEAKSEEREHLSTLHTRVEAEEKTLVPEDRYSSFTCLKRVTAWVMRFVQNCRSNEVQSKLLGPLSTFELNEAEFYWIGVVQTAYFNEVLALKKHSQLPSSSRLKALRPFIDARGLVELVAEKECHRVSVMKLDIH